MPSTSDVAQHLAYALQLAIGAVFLFSAVPKLRRPRSFAETVVQFEIIPAGPARVLAPALIAIESCLAAFLLAGWLPALALPLAAITLLLFALATVVNLRARS